MPSRATVTLTRRAWSLVGAAVGLVVGSYLLGSLEMLVIGVAALLLVAAAALWLATRRAPALSVTRRARPDRLHVGTEGQVDVAVENVGERATPVLAATDWFDEGRRAARFLVPSLAPGATARAAYRIPTRRRGRYVVGPLDVARADPFGLARRRVGGTGEAEVVIRPRVHDIVAPVAVGGRVVADSEAPAARAVVSDLGDEFLTLREYEQGDDLRRVHWRATARTGDLMIRQDEARWRSRAAVVLDDDARAYDADAFEVGVEAAASVVVRLVRLRRWVDVMTGSGEHLGRGGDPRHDVVDRLATVGLREEHRLPGVLEQLRAQRRVDLVVVVLGDLRPEAARALQGLAGLAVVAVLTRPAALAPRSSLVVVDASRAPFATAWNQTLSRSLTTRSRAAPWRHAPASSPR